MIKLNDFIQQRKVLLLSATFLCSVLWITSCKKKDDDFGANLQPNGDILDYEITDTTSLITYSVEDDSLRTDETTLNLLGSYVDPVMGVMKTGFITQFRLEADDPNFGDINSLSVDSVVISLRYGGAYGNIDPQNARVYRITEDIDTEESYYKYSQISNDGVDLIESGENAFTPDFENDVLVGNDTLSPQLRIPLDTNFGREIIDQSPLGNLADNDAFTAWLKGLFITVENPSQNVGEGGVMYFNLLDANSKMTLYFTEGGESKEFSLNINTNCARINVVESDYSGTRVEDLFQDKTLGQEEFYYQASGMRSAIEFPHLFALLDSFPNVIVNKAELILPVQYTTDDLLVPPLNLTVAAYDQSANAQSLIFDNFNPNHLDGEYDSDNKQYRFIITRYIQNVLKGDIPNDGLRLLSLEHFSSVARAVFNGPDTDKKFKPRLKLTLTTY